MAANPDAQLKVRQLALVGILFGKPPANPSQCRAKRRIGQYSYALPVMKLL
jgi:hypothetical protein